MHHAHGVNKHPLIVLADDFGWADHTLHDLGGDIPTPNLRALRDQGVLFDNLYVQPVCSPTRSALMTARFPFRDGMQHMSTIAPWSTAAIPLDTPTIAEMVTEQAGYEAHAIGKWHQGFASWRNVPVGRGFLTHTGYMQGQTDYWNHTFGVVNAFFDIGAAGLDFWKCKQPDQPLPDQPPCEALYSTAYSLDECLQREPNSQSPGPARAAC